MYGIYVADQAKPTLEGNTCNGNKAEPVRGSSETESAQAWTAVGWVLTIIAGLAWFIECQRRLALEEELRRLQRPGCVVLLLLFPILAFAGKIVAAELLYLLGIGG
jgi:hypothetical protein